MRTRTLIALSGACLALLTACKSAPESPEPPTGYFATYIEADGTKKFQYTIDFPERRGGRPNQPPPNMGGRVPGSSGQSVSGGVSVGTRQRPPGGAAGGYELFQQINTRLENALESALQKTRFCRDGHQETERVVEPQMVYIRGECKEKASDDDRKNFPNDA